MRSINKKGSMISRRRFKSGTKFFQKSRIEPGPPPINNPKSLIFGKEKEASQKSKYSKNPDSPNKSMVFSRSVAGSRSQAHSRCDGNENKGGFFSGAKKRRIRLKTKMKFIKSEANLDIHDKQGGKKTVVNPNKGKSNKDLNKSCVQDCNFPEPSVYSGMAFVNKIYMKNTFSNK